jgi:hypothetical protein
VRERHLVEARERVVGGHRQHRGFAPQRLLHHLALLEQRPHDREVRVAAAERGAPEVELLGDGHVCP